MFIILILVTIFIIGYILYSNTKSSSLNFEKSLFNDLVTTEKTPIIELNSAYGTTDLREDLSLTNSASKNDINGSLTTGEIKLSTGLVENSVATILSRQVGRYIPGYSSEIGIGVRFVTAPKGEQEARWGGSSKKSGDALFWVYDKNGLGVGIRKYNVDKIIYQKDWNLDKADGKGKSGITWNFLNGNVYDIQYTWYGYGKIRWGFVTGNEKEQFTLYVHEESNFDSTSITEPNLSLYQTVKNGNTSSNMDMYIGGRSYSILGKHIPRYRYTGDFRVSAVVGNGVPTPLLSFRLKEGYADRSVLIESYQITNLDNTNSAAISMRWNGQLTGATFGTPSDYLPSETGIEVDKSATAITGGTNIYAGDIVGPSKDGGGFNNVIKLDVPESLIVTLCAEGLGANVTLNSGFRIREEW